MANHDHETDHTSNPDNEKLSGMLAAMPPLSFAMRNSGRQQIELDLGGYVIDLSRRVSS